MWVDREVVLVAMQQGGGAPEYASEELWALRADREVVLAAMQQAGEALKYASEELRTDREVVLAAVRHENSRAGGGDIHTNSIGSGRGARWWVD